MAKRIFAVLVLLSAGAQANGLAQHSGGCVVFNEIIYEEVTASGWGMTGADLVFTNFREPSAMICTSTMTFANAPDAGIAQKAGNETAQRPRRGQRNTEVGSIGDDRKPRP